MEMDLKSSLNPGIYTDAFRAAWPGVLLGVMFVTVSLAAKSAAESEQQFVERSLQTKFAHSGNLRELISLSHGVMEASPVKENLTAATRAGLQKLNTPGDAAALERVTIEIELPKSNDAAVLNGSLPVELLEVLSRRASPLQLELTVRVAPLNAEIATSWIESVRKRAGLEQIVDVSRIAVSLDETTPMDKLRLDVLRTRKMVTRTESRR